jgi:anti-sigma28 factor (negative regulator of flagellin synthesis)
MNINNIAGSNSQTQAVGKNANVVDKYKGESTKAASQRAASAPKKGDKLELSAEAVKFEPIRRKIESGYYDKLDVIREVAEKVNRELLAT